MMGSASLRRDTEARSCKVIHQEPPRRCSVSGSHHRLRVVEDDIHEPSLGITQDVSSFELGEVGTEREDAEAV